MSAVPAAPRLFQFSIANAVCFNIALSAPLALMVNYWGASPLYIGALTALVPLFTTLQLAMAPRVEYIGFRRLMLMGWIGRTCILMLVALLPFLGGVMSNPARLAVLLILMSLFNILRGIGSGAWLPWVSELIPSRWRGRYVSMEQMMMNLAASATLFFCGWILGADPTDLHFGSLYILSCIAGWVSVQAMWRIPSPPAKTGRPVKEPLMHWARRLWESRPFRRAVRMNVVYMFIMAGVPTFTVIFLKDSLRIPEGFILYTTGASTLGSVVSSTVWGSLADRHGSRPVLDLATRVLLVALVCWLLMACRLIPGQMLYILPVFMLIGIGGVGYNIANIRYVLNNAPQQSPVFALSLFTVVSSLSQACSPFIWGLILEGLQDKQWRIGPMLVEGFSVFYLLAALGIVVVMNLLHRLPDRQASATHVVIYHLFIDYPLKPLNAVYKALRPVQPGE